ncbi:ATP-binding protein [uncultured Megasphaera sp.]|jgi:two-component system phosphate regulon sensor histidine kinase PhoR|uniref:sensor histidine kinase n=1 Tax=uncultured Megasphaera sp. TaxID=165188 RepID=UPI0025EA81B5|nr:ATP-binding protein [uncultured Megasphaera sp.]
MKRKVYLSLLFMGLACMAVTLLISTWFFWNSTQHQIQQELVMAMDVVETTIEEGKDTSLYLKKLGIHEPNGLRITWINTNGDVLFESDYDKGVMENHLARPEVKAAIENGKGTAVRDSQTVSKALYYYAKKLPDGTILRVSLERDTFYAHFFSLLPWALLLLGLSALACVKVSRLLTASLLSPLRQTALFIRQINDSHVKLVRPPRVDHELQPLVDKVFLQSQTITDNMHSLEQQRNIMRLIMENLQEGVILTDKSYGIAGLNLRAARFLGAENSQAVLQRNLQELIPDAPWGRLQHIDSVCETKLIRADRLYLMTLQPVYKDDDFYGMLFIIDDVTEQEHREQLRREFTSNVSHELKTPLTSISGFAEVLATGIFKNKDDVIHFGTLIRKEALRLLQMIEEIMHLARIEDGKRKVNLERLCLRDLVQDIVEFMEPVLMEKKVTVHCTMDDTEVQADCGLFREMIMNLLDNAVKYNRPGGHVYIDVHHDVHKAFFVIRDTGIGIPEDKQQRVFERFYRADSSRSRKIKGTGLGLAIVKHIVEQHRGTIHLDSKENEGTTITVTLPM